MSDSQLQNVKPKLSGCSSQSCQQRDRPKGERSLSGCNSQGRQKRDRPIGERSRRSRSSESGRGRRAQRHLQAQRQRRGRSEEARRPDQRKVPEDDVDDTECAVCFCSYDNVFKTPKLLACGHTFCLECLARINVTSLELKSLTCPVCREVTPLPHGQDLPRLSTNQHIVHKLPPPMQRLLSVRFKRRQGKLLLKSAPPQGAPSKPSQSPDPELGLQARTEVDVGRPPSRVRGRLRSLFRSDRCYYAAVASVITVTVVLMMIGILAFVIVPHVVVHRPPLGPHGNHTSGELSGAEP